MSQALLPPRHAERFRQLVHRTTGIQLSPEKRSMIETRLRSRVGALGLPDLDAYFHHLFEEGGAEAELSTIIELMTTNKTDFFREKPHYDLLSQRIVPEALARTRSGGRMQFKLWSAAASTGAEAWSAAMLLAATQARQPAFGWAVLGTDISQRVLATARRAVYPETELDPVPPELRDRFTMRGQDRHGTPTRRIVPELRSRVRFAELNLVEPPYPVDRDIHAIFLRNVLIYFDSPTQARVIAAMADHLRPGGYLIVGHAESMLVRLPSLRPTAPGVFAKADASRGRP